MEEVTYSLEYQALSDKELTFLNAVILLFDSVGIKDVNERARCINYLHQRFGAYAEVETKV